MNLDRGRATGVLLLHTEGEITTSAALDALEESVQPDAYDTSMRDLLTSLRLEQAKLAAIADLCDEAEHGALTLAGETYASAPTRLIRAIISGNV